MHRLSPLVSIAFLALLAACSGGGGTRVTGEDAGETEAEAAGEDVGVEQAVEASDLDGDRIDQDPTFDDPALP